jgi:hypothetical protein
MANRKTLPPTEAQAMREIALDANFEVLQLAKVLRKLIEDRDAGAEIATVARGILTRIGDLSDIVFEAVLKEGDDREDLPTLRRKMGMDPIREAVHG